jgi:hypothetical protein
MQAKHTLVIIKVDFLQICQKYCASQTFTKHKANMDSKSGCHC